MRYLFHGVLSSIAFLVCMSEQINEVDPKGEFVRIFVGPSLKVQNICSEFILKKASIFEVNILLKECS